MAAIMCNPVTLTRGVPASDLPEDWTEAEMELKERSYDDGEEHSLKFIAAVYAWGWKEFGRQAYQMPFVELAGYWYEFAD